MCRAGRVPADIGGHHTEAEDSLRYLYEIRSGAVNAISNPYHLAYGWYGWVGYHLALALGYGGGPLLPVQILDAVTGALGIGLLWALLRTVSLRRTAAAVGCGLLAFSYGFWWYSVEVEVYILSAVLLIGCLFLAYRAVIHPTWRRFALLGAAHGLAMLAHNTNALFGIVVLAALVLGGRTMPFGRVLRCAAAYAVAGILVVVSAYTVVVTSIALRTRSAIFDWLTGYAQSGQWGQWDQSSIPKAMVGAGRALVGGHFAFALGPVRDIAIKSFANKSLREEVFLVRGYSTVLALLLLVLVAVVAVGLMLPVLHWLRHPTLVGRGRVLALLSLSWLVPYSLFFVWWEPQNIEFWISPGIPLAILFALIFGSRRARSRHRETGYVAVLVSALLLLNLLGSVWPQHGEDDDYWRVRAAWYERNATSADLIVAYDYQETYYLRYFTSAEVIDVKPHLLFRGVPATIAVVEREIAEDEGRRVLFSNEVFFPSTDAYSECTDARACEVWAPAMREAFLSRTSVVARQPLEDVRELTRR